MSITNELLERYRDRLDTRCCVIAQDAIEACYEPLSAELGTDGTWLVAADENTWEAAGAAVARVLDAAGQPWQRFEVVAQPGEPVPVCDDGLIAAYQAAMRDCGATAGLAVGSGTINDIVKMAAHLEQKPMGVVCTAPSMNGYTSGIAAVLSDGVKTTNPCTAPRVVIADLDVMAEAPYRMLCSGLGDLMSKPVSNSDWALSARLNGTPHSAEAMAIIEAGAALLDGVAEAMPGRDREAVGRLTASLMLSGIAMSVAGSSSPASGGEHLISHYIDMTGYAHDLPHDLHGCQVGVGTLTTALIYERLRALDPADIDIEATADRLVDWPDYEATLRGRFGVLFDAVVEHARPAYPSRPELVDRLERLCAQWDDMVAEVGQTLRTAASLEAELAAARCPTRFAQLGVDRERARQAIVWSKDIRNRYTILHLAWELGYLDAWADEALDALYD